jgi:hypothetical protein
MAIPTSSRCFVAVDVGVAVAVAVAAVAVAVAGAGGRAGRRTWRMYVASSRLAVPVTVLSNDRDDRDY